MHRKRRAIVALALVYAMAAAAAPSAHAAQISPLAPAIRRAMTGVAWHPGCPVPLDDLRAVRIRYFGFDARTHAGTLVVHRRFAASAAAVFADLYALRFPIERVAGWEAYGPDRYAEQNVTVGFYCEKADDAPTEWSSHAYGMAIDINPRLNPFRNPGRPWWPRNAGPHARTRAPGTIWAGGPAFLAFARHGWKWGGFDPVAVDYMHFSKVTVGSGDPTRRHYEVTRFDYTP